MPSLVYIAEDSQNVSYPLGKGVFSIGSKGDSSLQLTSSQIAPEQASIVYEEGQYHLRDHGSESGSYVNGERVTHTQLKHHDILRFGEYRFRMNLFDVVDPTPVSNPANMETSRIDLPPELVRRATRGLPSVADVRRVVVESRPQSLKAAETSQIEPAGLPKKVTKAGKLSDSAVVKPVQAGGRPAAMVPSSTAPVKGDASLVVKEEQTPLPAWAWFTLGAVLAAVATAAAMHFFRS